MRNSSYPVDYPSYSICWRYHTELFPDFYSIPNFKLISGSKINIIFLTKTFKFWPKGICLQISWPWLCRVRVMLDWAKPWKEELRPYQTPGGIFLLFSCYKAEIRVSYCSLAPLPAKPSKALQKRNLIFSPNVRQAFHFRHRKNNELQRVS